MRVANLVLTGTGFCLIVLGIITVIDPAIFTRLYQIGLPTQTSKTTIVAIIGGSEIGAGIVFILRKKLQLDDRTLACLGGAVFSGILTIRFIMHYQYGKPFNFLEGVAECALAFLLLYTAHYLKRPIT